MNDFFEAVVVIFGIIIWMGVVILCCPLTWIIIGILVFKHC